MSELEDSFAKLLGRQPSDADRQRLYRVRDALGLKNNDALWLVLMALQHYETLYTKIPASIKSAAQESAQGAAAQAQSEVNKAVAALVPTVEKAVGKAAAGAAGRVKLGESMLSIWAGMIALGITLALGWLLGSHTFSSYQLGNITIEGFWHEIGWGLGIGTAIPGLVLIFGLNLTGNNDTEWWQWLSGVFALGGVALLALNFLGYT